MICGKLFCSVGTILMLCNEEKVDLYKFDHIDFDKNCVLLLLKYCPFSYVMLLFYLLGDNHQGIFV
jgi:hypothetical protein